MARYSRPIKDAFLPSEQRGFVETFREAFGGAPYNEHYTDTEILEIWDKHLADGIIILADEGGQVIGFGCTVPLSKAPADVYDFLRQELEAGELPDDFKFDTAWYMSELGVRESARQRKVGYHLVRHRMMSISKNGGHHFVMRTATAQSNSRHLYEMIGARPLATEQDISATEQVQVNGSESTSRVYLWGDSKTAIQEIVKRIKTEGTGDALLLDESA